VDEVATTQLRHTGAVGEVGTKHKLTKKEEQKKKKEKLEKRKAKLAEMEAVREGEKKKWQVRNASSIISLLRRCTMRVAQAAALGHVNRSRLPLRD
jgi:hypothetical protein